jgi:anti-sigma B factor antagonist
MEITQRAVGEGTCVVALEGTLNASSADQVKGIFVTVAEQGMRQVVIDLTKVPFVDSSGLAALVSGLKTLNSHNGNLKVAGLQSQADLLFKLTMFDKVFQIYPDVESALKSFPT